MEKIQLDHPTKDKTKGFDLDCIRLWLPKAHYGFTNSYKFSLTDNGFIDVVNPQFKKTVKTKITTLKQWIAAIEKELEIDIDGFVLTHYSRGFYEKNYNKKDLEK